MFKFHPLKVASVSRVAEDAVCVALDVPPDLEADFAFHAGQYVTVRQRLGARDERRTYSIVSPPAEKGLKLGVRVHHNGLMSRHLAHDVRPGDFLDVGTPTGRFRTEIDPQRTHTYVAFVAGSGITPVLSLAAAILAREPKAKFELFYGNRSISRTMFLEEVLALKNRYIQRFSVHFLMSREQQQAPWLNGRLDGAKIRELARALPEVGAADEYLVCGPGDMVDEVRAALLELNAASRVRFERFATSAAPTGTAAKGTAATGTATPIEVLTKTGTGTGPESKTETETRTKTESAATDPVLAIIAVTMDGRRRTFPMSPNDPSVLDAAERAGIELPFSCRAGICATCRTRITAGAAVMRHNIGLERWELDAGFVLCCQARPTTSTFEITYDEK